MTLLRFLQLAIIFLLIVILMVWQVRHAPCFLPFGAGRDLMVQECATPMSKEPHDGL
jgi:hypothetical protein